MQFFTDTMERWRTFDLSIADIVIFAIPFLVIYVWLSIVGAAEELDMNEKRFRMRKHKGHIFACLIVLPVVSAIVFLRVLIVGGTPFPDILFVPLGIIGIGVGIPRLFWEVRVDGNEFQYKCLWRQKSFSLNEIQRVEIRGANRARMVGVNLYLADKKLFFVHKNDIGFSLFEKRLKKANVPGAEMIYHETGHWSEAATGHREEEGARKEIEPVEKPIEPIPAFKYHPYPLETGGLEQDSDPVLCERCGRETKVYYNSPYYPDPTALEYLCPHCIADGSASRKFHVKFQDPAFCEKVEDEGKLEELCTRTPGYFAPRQSYWLAHCDDFCALIGDIFDWDQIREMGLASEIETDWVANRDLGIEDISHIREHLKSGGEYDGYLFRCLHCGKYRLYVDQKE